jgi:hypothetical protein
MTTTYSKRWPLLIVLTSPLFFLGALGAGYAVLEETRTWWSMRGYVEVDAKVRQSALQKGRTFRRGSRPRLNFSYTYNYGNREYTGSRPGNVRSHFRSPPRYMADKLENAQRFNSPVTIWIDPERPQMSALDKSFAWEWTATMFVGALLAVFAPLDLLLKETNRSHPGRRVPSVAGSWRVRRATVIVWNLLAWPVAIIAPFEIAAYGGSWPWLALLTAAVGLGAAVLAWTQYLNERRLGSVVLENLAPGSATLNARLHFTPPLGERCGPATLRIAITVELRQVIRSEKNTGRVSVAWEKIIDQGRNDRGSAVIDISADLPFWDLSPEVEPAYWEVRLSALGTERCFRLAP